MAKFIERECSKHGITTFVLEGRNYYRCKQCRSFSVAEKRRQLKKQLVEEAGGKCQACGYKRAMRSLTFHHIDPTTKSFGLALRGLSRSLVKLRIEAAKCVLMCANCHGEIEDGVLEISKVFWDSKEKRRKFVFIYTENK